MTIDGEVIAAILDSPWEREQEPEIVVIISLDADAVDEAFVTIIDAPTVRMEVPLDRR